MYFDLRLNYITQKYLEPQFLFLCFIFLRELRVVFNIEVLFLTTEPRPSGYFPPYTVKYKYISIYKIFINIKDFPFNWCRQTILCPR